MWDRLLAGLVRRLLKTGDLSLRLPNGDVIKAGNGDAPSVKVDLHDPTLPRKLI